MLRILFSIIALVLGIQFTYSQKLNDYFFDNYSAEQGLVHSHVLSIFQDSRGLIWVGTYGGVQSFNGYAFNRFNVVGKNHKKNILSNNVVQAIFEDQQGVMWFGTENGLNSYNPYTGATRQYYSADGLASNNIRAIDEDNDGNLWLATYNGGLCRLNSQRDAFKNYLVDTTQDKSLPTNIVNTLNVDGQQVWVGTENGGVSLFDISKEKVVLNIENLPDNKGRFTVNTFSKTDANTLWIGTWDRGLICYTINSGHLKQYLEDDRSSGGLSGNNIRHIILAEQNTLWVSTYGNGIHIFDTKNEHFTHVKIESLDEEEKSQDFIWTSFFDADNNLWFGSFGRGLFRLNNLKSTFLIRKVAVGKQKVVLSCLARKDDETTYLGTMNQGIVVGNDKTNNIKSFESNRFLEPEIHSLCVDSKGKLWVGQAELNVIDEKGNIIRRFKPDTQNKNGIPNGIIDHIIEDEHGNIWIGLWEGGVFKIDTKELIKPDSKVLFQSYASMVKKGGHQIVGNVSALWEDANNNIWIGTPEKVLVYNPQTSESMVLPISVVNSFYQDAYGNFWLTTSGAGLVKVDQNMNIEKRYSYDDGFDCIDIQSLEVDEQGRLWMGTSCGLSMLDLKTDVITNFGENYGFKPYNNSLNIAQKMDNNLLMFGGANVLTSFNANSIQKNIKIAPVYISDIKINNQSVAYENTLDSSVLIPTLMANLDTFIVDASNKTMTIRFATVNYELPNDIIYAYQLMGVDKDWIISEAKNRTVTYSNLTPGKYLFKVKNTLHLGQWNEEIKELILIVLPKSYQTLVFKLSTAIIGLLLIYLFIRLLFRKNRLVLVLKQKALFADELKKEKEILDLKNEELQATVEQYNAKIQNLSLKYQALKENMGSIYKQLINTKSDDLSDSALQVEQIRKTIDEKIHHLDKFNVNETIELDKDDFLVRFAKAYPKLSSNDLRICTLIRKNISNKDIAEQLNITSGSLEQSRYRMRKKMGLSSDVNLNELILRF